MHCTAVTRRRPIHDQASGSSLSKASKSFTRQRPVCSRHQDLRSLKTFKNFTPCILYEITNHLLQQVESQRLSKCRKTCKQVDIRRSYNTQPKSLKNVGDQLRCIFTRLLRPLACGVGAYIGITFADGRHHHLR